MTVADGHIAELMAARQTGNTSVTDSIARSTAQRSAYHKNETLDEAIDEDLLIHTLNRTQ